MNRRQRRLTSPVPAKASTPVAAQSKAAARPWWQGDWSLLVAMLVGFAVYRLSMLAYQPGPPGSDAGNWLAFTRELFGTSVKSAESMYFPGTLVILKVLLIFLPDLSALKLLAVISSIALAVPFYFLARLACNKGTALLLAALLLMTGFLLEMMAWGGYPQLLASAYMLAALLYMDRWIRDGSRSDVVKAAVFTGLVALTHHFMLLIMVAVVIAYLAPMAFNRRHEAVEFGNRVATYGGAAAIACLVSLPWYLQYLSLLAGKGSLNATAEQTVGRGDILSYVFSEAPLTWIALCTVIPIIAMLPFGNAGTKRLRPVAGALTFAPLAVYLVTDEHRAIQVVQCGALLSLGLIAAYAQSFLAGLQISPTIGLAGRATVALAGLGLMLIIVPNSHTRTEIALDNNRAMDASAQQAMTWLRENTPPGSVILPSNRRGLVNYAWWVEGFAQRPAYGLINPNYLAFKEEVVQSEIANRIVDASTPLDEVQRLLAETRISYLFIYKPSGGDFQRLADSIPVTLTYQNDDFVIFKVPVASASAH